MSSFKELIKQLNEPSSSEATEEIYHDIEGDSDSDSLPLMDEFANSILMHRNAHFGGKFDFMLEYYTKDGPACSGEFGVSDIQKLTDLELKMKQDLSFVKLSGTELAKIKSILELYSGLRKLHSVSQDKYSIPTLLANLILTEEEFPTKEIEELSKNEKALTYLIDLLRSDDFSDPLYPGYGRSPMHAATCLGKMKSEKAIVPLFETMKTDNFFYEEAMILALKNIGEPAFNFLLTVLQNEPFTLDNEKAAICLTSFGENKVFAKTSLKMLQNFQSLNLPNLVVHLILACLGLEDKEEIESFLQLEKQLPHAFGPDFQYVSSKLKRKAKV